MTYILRSEKYGTHTLETPPKFNQKVEFTGDGSDYLEKAYETDGIEAEVFLDIINDGVKDTKRIDFTKYEYHYGNKMVLVELK